MSAGPATAAPCATGAAYTAAGSPFMGGASRHSAGAGDAPYARASPPVTGAPGTAGAGGGPVDLAGGTCAAGCGIASLGATRRAGVAREVAAARSRVSFELRLRCLSVPFPHQLRLGRGRKRRPRG